MAFTIIIDYYAGLKIEQSAGKNRRLYLILSLIANIGVLAVFKYYSFITQNVSWLLQYSEKENPFPVLSILLPIGLSFHTFQAMSYTIEVYRGKQKAEHHFGIYALYVMFYPQLVAGPIERPQNILHQFYEKHTFDFQRICQGLKLMLWGFFMKMVIADNLALIANPVFDNAHHYKGLAIIIAIFAFTIQIFCDFAGYSSIALGAAKVMGFTLMNNFRRPYLAESVSEFWTRWHISLSTWFKDYVYITLGGNKVGAYKWGLNIFIVFMLSGLWHGANWTYVIWGIIHAMFLITGKFSSPLRAKIAKTIGLTNLPILNRFLNIGVTFSLVSFAWIFFRAPDLDNALYMLKNMFTNWHLNDLKDTLNLLGFGRLPKTRIVLFLGILLFEQLYQEYFGSLKALLTNQPMTVRWSIYFIILFSIFLFGAYQEVRFIYFQF